MRTLKDWVLAAMLASLLVISKEILAFLPNIELVSFLLIVFSLTLGVKIAMQSAFLFAFLQMLLYGIGTWTPVYFVVWPLLAWVTDRLKKGLNSAFRLALLSGCFGFMFGFFFAIPYFLIDVRMGWAYYLKGLFYDAVHGIGNYLVMLLLYQPVYPVLVRLANRLH